MRFSVERLLGSFVIFAAAMALCLTATYLAIEEFDAPQRAVVGIATQIMIGVAFACWVYGEKAYHWIRAMLSKGGTFKK